MNKLAKILLTVVGLFLVLTATLAIFLPLFFDPNDYKDDIAQAVEDRIGRKLTIEGEIDLSFFPWLGLEVGETRLSNAPGFGEEPFASMNSADVRVKLLPLLRKQIQFGTMSLNGLRLRLARNAQGRTNWQDILENLEEEDVERPVTDGQDDKDFEIPNLVVGGVEIEDAAVFWKDAEFGADYKLENLNLTTGRLSATEPFLLNMDFSITSGKPAITSNVKVVSDVQPDLNANFYRFRDLRINVLSKGEGIPAEQLQANLNGDLVLDMAQQKLKLSQFNGQLAGLSITGSLDGTQIVDDPSFSGGLQVKKFNPRNLMKNLGNEPIQTTDSSVLTTASMEVEFDATLNQANLKQLKARLDESTLNGTATVRDFGDPAIEFALNLDKINIDRYLPPETQTETGTETEIPVDLLEGLNLDGRVNAGQIILAGLTFTDATLVLTAQDGRLQIKPLTSKFYDGTINVNGSANANPDTPTYNLNADVSGVNAGPFIKDLTGEDRISGLGRLNLNLTSAGRTLEQAQRAMDGNLNFEFTDGSLKGFNLGQILRKAQARYKGEPFDDAAQPTTDFSTFSGAYRINNGVMQGDDLHGKSPALRVDGGGSVNLVQMTLDHLVNASIVDTIASQGGADLERLKGLTIPIRLTGPLFNPEYSIDFAAALKGVAKEKLAEERAELEEKVESRIEEERQEQTEKLREKFSELLGGKKDQEAEPEQPAGEPATEAQTSEQSDTTQ